MACGGGLEAKATAPSLFTGAAACPKRTWCSAPNDNPQRAPLRHVTSRSASRRGAKPNRARARARPPRAGRVRVVERHATVTGQIAPSVPGGPQSAPNLFVALEAPTTPTRRTAGRCRRSSAAVSLLDLFVNDRKFLVMNSIFLSY